jgi:hypothetical protein
MLALIKTRLGVLRFKSFRTYGPLKPLRLACFQVPVQPSQCYISPRYRLQRSLCSVGILSSWRHLAKSTWVCALFKEFVFAA